MIWPSTYSPRTICPECRARIKLEDVRFAPKFSCPHCGEEIRVADAYRHTLQGVGWSLGALVPYALGVRSWLLLLAWAPCSMVLFGVWGYVGKYFVPPRLQSTRVNPPSVLGLGPK
jgi:predicted RNA-binding Zn-ribbon protein involved in translation (DUF1610 family)